MLVLTADAVSAIAIIAVDGAGVMKNQLPDPFTDRQDDRFVLVEVINFEGYPINVTRVDPTGIKTDGHAVASPAAPRLDFAGASMGADTDEFVGVGQNSFAGSEHNNWVVLGDICE